MSLKMLGVIISVRLGVMTFLFLFFLAGGIANLFFIVYI